MGSVPLGLLLLLFAFGRFQRRFGCVLETTKNVFLLQRLRSRPKGVTSGPCGLQCGPECSQKYVRRCFLCDRRKCRNCDVGTPSMRFERFFSYGRVRLGHKSVHVRCLFVQTFRNPPWNKFFAAWHRVKELIDTERYPSWSPSASCRAVPPWGRPNGT